MRLLTMFLLAVSMLGAARLAHAEDAFMQKVDRLIADQELYLEELRGARALHTKMLLGGEPAQPRVGFCTLTLQFRPERPDQTSVAFVPGNCALNADIALVSTAAELLKTSLPAVPK